MTASLIGFALGSSMLLIYKKSPSLPSRHPLRLSRRNKGWQTIEFEVNREKAGTWSPTRAKENSTRVV